MSCLSHLKPPAPETPSTSDEVTDPTRSPDKLERVKHLENQWGLVISKIERSVIRKIEIKGHANTLSLEILELGKCC